MYRHQDCQRQKGSCWNIYVTTLDYTHFLAHGFMLYDRVFPFSTDIDGRIYWCKYGFLYTCDFIFVVSIYIKVRNHSPVGSCHSWDTWKSALFPDFRRDSWQNLFTKRVLKDYRWSICHLISVVKSAALKKSCYLQVPGSILAKNTSTQIHMDLSKDTLMQGF